MLLSQRHGKPNAAILDEYWRMAAWLLARKNRRTRTKYCSSETYYTTNLTCNHSGLNLIFCSEIPSSNRLSYGTFCRLMLQNIGMMKDTLPHTFRELLYKIFTKFIPFTFPAFRHQTFIIYLIDRRGLWICSPIWPSDISELTYDP